MSDFYIDPERIQDGSLSADKLKSGSITADKISDGTITAGKLAVGSVISGLSYDSAIHSFMITPNKGSATDLALPLATTTTDGLMSAADKTTIASMGMYVSLDGGTTTTQLDEKQLGQPVLNLNGSGISIALQENEDTGNDEYMFSVAEATSSKAGLMSASDKQKVDGLNGYRLVSSTEDIPSVTVLSTDKVILVVDASMTGIVVTYWDSDGNKGSYAGHDVYIIASKEASGNIGTTATSVTFSHIAVLTPGIPISSISASAIHIVYTDCAAFVEPFNCVENTNGGFS